MKPGKNGNVVKRGAGRPKGKLNKFTTLKQSFMDAYEGTGGTKELIKWAKKEENRKDFYSFITKLLPKEIEGTVDLKGFDQLGERLADALAKRKEFGK